MGEPCAVHGHGDAPVPVGQRERDADGRPNQRLLLVAGRVVRAGEGFAAPLRLGQRARRCRRDAKALTGRGPVPLELPGAQPADEVRRVDRARGKHTLREDQRHGRVVRPGSRWQQVRPAADQVGNRREGARTTVLGGLAERITEGEPEPRAAVAVLQAQRHVEHRLVRRVDVSGRHGPRPVDGRPVPHVLELRFGFRTVRVVAVTLALLPQLRESGERRLAVAELSGEVAANDQTRAADSCPAVHVDAVPGGHGLVDLVEDFHRLFRPGGHAVIRDRPA